MSTAGLFDVCLGDVSIVWGTRNPTEQQRGNCRTNYERCKNALPTSTNWYNIICDTVMHDSSGRLVIFEDEGHPPATHEMPVISIDLHRSRSGTQHTEERRGHGYFKGCKFTEEAFCQANAENPETDCRRLTIPVSPSMRLDPSMFPTGP